MAATVKVTTTKRKGKKAKPKKAEEERIRQCAEYLVYAWE